MIEFILDQKTLLLVVLGVYLSVSLVEILSNPPSEQIPIGDRLLNVGAGILFLLVGGYLAWLAIIKVMQFGLYRRSSMDPFLYVLVFVLIQDFIYYFYHRFQHNWSFLWGIHKFHHTDSDVNVTTSHRTNLLEQPVQFFVVSLPPTLLLGVHPSGLLWATYIGLFFLYLSHSKLDIGMGLFSPVFVGPRYHRVHHSQHPQHLNKNFAQFFPFIDLAFGTYVKPLPLGKVKTGVMDCSTFRDQWTPLFWPLTLLRKPGQGRVTRGPSG